MSVMKPETQEAFNMYKGTVDKPQLNAVAREEPDCFSCGERFEVGSCFCESCDSYTDCFILHTGILHDE